MKSVRVSHAVAATAAAAATRNRGLSAGRAALSAHARIVALPRRCGASAAVSGVPRAFSTGSDALLVLSDGTVVQGTSIGRSLSDTGAGDGCGAAGVAVAAPLKFESDPCAASVASNPAHFGDLVALSTAAPMPIEEGHRMATVGRTGASGSGAYAAGLVLGPCDGHSVGRWAAGADIPLVAGIDVRRVMDACAEASQDLMGAIVDPSAGDGVVEAALAQLNAADRNLLLDLSPASRSMLGVGNRFRVGVVDMGASQALLENLTARNMEVRCLPFDTALEKEVDVSKLDGLVIAGARGDVEKPELAVLVNELSSLMDVRPDLPLLAVGAGHLVLCKALGAHVGPVDAVAPAAIQGANTGIVDEARGRSVLVAGQYNSTAVRERSLPPEVTVRYRSAVGNVPLGLEAKHNPWWSVQFEPAHAGRSDAERVLDEFSSALNPGAASQPALKQTPVRPSIARRSSFSPKVLIIAGGDGTSGASDYAVSAALRACSDERHQTVLLSPVATPTNSSVQAGASYFLPLTLDHIEMVIEREKPQSLLLCAAGSEGAKLAAQLHKRQVLQKFGVEVLGTSLETRLLLRDRAALGDHLRLHGVRMPKCTRITSTREADRLMQHHDFGAQEIIVRSDSSDRGGCSVDTLCSDRVSVLSAVEDAVAQEGDAAGKRSIWLEEFAHNTVEVSMEVVRDGNGGICLVSSVESLRQSGVHGLDNVLTTPVQSIPSRLFYRLRELALQTARSLEIVGNVTVRIAAPLSESGCFTDDEPLVLGISPRVTPTSSLVAKATGFPVAWVSAKAELGLMLSDCIPEKLEVTPSAIGSRVPLRYNARERQLSPLNTNASVCLGLTFVESMQKALRSASGDALLRLTAVMSDSEGNALRPVSSVLQRQVGHLAALEGLVEAEELWNLAATKSAASASFPAANLLAVAKAAGISDALLAKLVAGPVNEENVRDARARASVTPRTIPVGSGVEPSKGNRAPSGNFEGSVNFISFFNNGLRAVKPPSFGDKPALVLGVCGLSDLSGDVASLSASTVASLRAMAQAGIPTIAVTSTIDSAVADCAESSRLYIEDMSVETLREIFDAEGCAAVVSCAAGEGAAQKGHVLQDLGLTSATDGGSPFMRGERPGRSVGLPATDDAAETGLVFVEGFARDGKVVGALLGEQISKAGSEQDGVFVCPPTSAVTAFASSRVSDLTREAIAKAKLSGPFGLTFAMSGPEVRLAMYRDFVSPFTQLAANSTSADLVGAGIRAALDLRPTRQDGSIGGLPAAGQPWEVDSRYHAIQLQRPSSGSVVSLGESLEESFVKALLCAGKMLPMRTADGSKRKHILVKLGDDVDAADDLYLLSRLGLKLCADDETAARLRQLGLEVQPAGRTTSHPTGSSASSKGADLPWGKVGLVVDLSGEDASWRRGQHPSGVVVTNKRVLGMLASSLTEDAARPMAALHPAVLQTHYADPSEPTWTERSHFH